MKKLIILAIIVLFLIIGWEVIDKYLDYKLRNQEPKFTLDEIKEKVINSNMVNYFNEIYDNVEIRVEDNKLLFNVNNYNYEFELKNSILSSNSVSEPLTNQIYMTVYDAIGMLQGMESEDTFETYNGNQFINYKLHKEGVGLIKSDSWDIEIDINKKPPYIKGTSWNSYIEFIGGTVDIINKSKKKVAEITMTNYARAINNTILEYYLESGNYPNNYDNLDVSLSGELPVDCDITFLNNKVKLTNCKIASYSNINTCSYVDEKAVCQ